MPRQKRSSGSKSQPGQKSQGQHSRKSKTTTDHQEIRRWAEDRGGRPCVETSGDTDELGMIVIEFPGTPQSRGETLDEITWDDWFDAFDDNDLALVYEEETPDGKSSNSHTLVKQQGGRANARGAGSSR